MNVEVRGLGLGAEAGAVRAELGNVEELIDADGRGFVLKSLGDQVLCLERILAHFVTEVLDELRLVALIEGYKFLEGRVTLEDANAGRSVTSNDTGISS